VHGLTLSNGVIFAPLDVTSKLMVCLHNLHLHSDSKQRGALCVSRSVVRCTSCSIHGAVNVRASSTLDLLDSALHGGGTEMDGSTGVVVNGGSELNMVNSVVSSYTVGVSVVASGSSAVMKSCKLNDCHWGAVVNTSRLRMTDCEVAACSFGAWAQLRCNFTASGTMFRRCNNTGVVATGASDMQLTSCSFDGCVIGMNCVDATLQAVDCGVSDCGTGIRVNGNNSVCKLSRAKVLDCATGADVRESGRLRASDSSFMIGTEAFRTSIASVSADGQVHGKHYVGISAEEASQVDLKATTTQKCHIGVRAAYGARVDIQCGSLQHNAIAVSSSYGSTVAVTGCAIVACSAGIGAMLGGSVHVKEGTVLQGSHDAVFVQEGGSVFGACCRCGDVGRRLMACKCRRVRYCGKECQAADWREHKKSCGK
jgi:hypothetical protein